MREQEYIEIEDCKLLRQTEKAGHFKIEDQGEFWIPWSQISDDCELQKNGDTGTLLATEWILNEKEIEY